MCGSVFCVVFGSQCVAVVCIVFIFGFRIRKIYEKKKEKKKLIINAWDIEEIQGL